MSRRYRRNHTRHARPSPIGVKREVARLLLARPAGASLTEIAQATGWSAATSRVQLSELRRFGARIRLDRTTARYHIEPEPAAGATGPGLVEPAPGPGMTLEQILEAVRAAYAAGQASVRPAAADTPVQGKAAATGRPSATAPPSSGEVSTHEPEPAEAAPEPAELTQTKREIVAQLLVRPEGATYREIIDAVGWPSVSVPHMARVSGLRLRIVRDGRKLRYFGKRRR